MKWQDVFCNDTCSLLDKHNITYFGDFLHTNYYGTLFFGDYVRKLYDNWVKKIM